MGHLLQGRYKALLVQVDSGEYFSTLSNYIHLNPVRIKGSGAEALSTYRWSSYPLYLRASSRPDWLVVERVLGALGFPGDQNGRTRYRRHMQKRALEVESTAGSARFEKQWEGIRRGWYLGSESFRDELLDRVDGLLKGKQRNSFGGAEVRLHDEAEADRILFAGLRCLGLDAERLNNLPKGAPEKAVLAWILRKRTIARRSWIAQRLCMGEESRVTKLVRDVEKSASYDELKKKLQRIPELPFHCFAIAKPLSPNKAQVSD